MLYYPYKTMFSAYKTVIGSPCACDLFVSKVTKITRYMDVSFWRSFFGAFSVCDDCILKSTKAWLLKLSVLYIHSFMQVHNTTFQIKTVFNNVLFSTEVHNPLHAHLLALSHIYIYIWLSAKRCANGRSDFWLSMKSVSSTLPCCCFVCAFIIGQYHSGNNMSSKSGAAGEIFIFESKSATEFDPWEWTCSWWVLLMLLFMYMMNQNITSVTNLYSK